MVGILLNFKYFDAKIAEFYFVTVGCNSALFHMYQTKIKKKIV